MKYRHIESGLVIESESYRYQSNGSQNRLIEISKCNDPFNPSYKKVRVKRHKKKRVDKKFEKKYGYKKVLDHASPKIDRWVENIDALINFEPDAIPAEITALDLKKILHCLVSGEPPNYEIIDKLRAAIYSMEGK